MADPDLRVFRETFLKQLSAPALDSLRTAKAVLAFVEEAGKNAAARRARIRQTVTFATDFYRHLLHTVGDSTPSEDALLHRLAEQARTHRPDEEQVAKCLDRCLEAFEEIDRNANQATLIECWLDDLARLY